MILKRLADPDSDATELERRLLASRTDPKPRANDRAAVWQRLMLGLTELPEADPTSLPDELVPSAPAPSAGGMAPSAPLAWGPLVLSGVFGLSVGVVATTSFFLLSGRESSPPPLAPLSSPSASALDASIEPNGRAPTGASVSPPGVASEPSAPATRGVPNVSQEERVGQAVRSAPHPGGESVAGVPSASAANAASRLRQEAALLRQAREQIRRGSLDEASNTLAKSRSAFPDSTLLQEREALTIELYMLQGRTLEAQSLASVFLAKYPHSPHAAQVRRALHTEQRPAH